MREDLVCCDVVQCSRNANPFPITLKIDLSITCNHASQERVSDLFQTRDSETLLFKRAERIIRDLTERETV